MVGLIYCLFRAVCRADGWVLVFNFYFVEKGTEDGGARSRFIFVLGIAIAHGGIVGMLIDKHGI